MLVLLQNNSRQFGENEREQLHQLSTKWPVEGKLWMNMASEAIQPIAKGRLEYFSLVDGDIQFHKFSHV